MCILLGLGLPDSHWYTSLDCWLCWGGGFYLELHCISWTVSGMGSGLVIYQGLWPGLSENCLWNDHVSGSFWFHIIKLLFWLICCFCDSHYFYHVPFYIIYAFVEFAYVSGIVNELYLNQMIKHIVCKILPNDTKLNPFLPKTDVSFLSQGNNSRSRDCI